MKIAVTGATGFVGRHLVNKLLLQQHDVTVLVHKHYSNALFSDTVNYLSGSVEDVESLEKTFEGIEVVYHLVGIIVETKTKTFDRTVAAGTGNVVAACQSAGVKKIIYLSALGTSKDAQTKYHRTKYSSEQAIISSGLDYIIYRASVIYGPNDGFVSLLRRLITLLPITPVIGSGKYLLQPIFIYDLVDALVKGLQVTEAVGEIIDVAGPEKLKYVEILNIIKQVLNKKRLNFYIPMMFMKTLARLLEKLTKPAFVTYEQLVMLEMDNTGDITKMKNLFSINPIKLEDGLRKYLR